MWLPVLRRLFFEAAYQSELQITPGIYEAGMTLYNCSGNYVSIKLGKFEALDQ